MPKKTKKRRKIRLKYVLIGLASVLIIGLIAAQICFNKFIYNQTNEQSTLKITLLIQQALEGLDELKSEPTLAADGSMLIPEARLKLPPKNDEVRRLMYTHSPADSGDDGHGYHWDNPESIQITTGQLSRGSRQKLLAQNSVDAVFDLVPEAQACNRGVLLLFQPVGDDVYKLVGKKSLGDGRNLYVYHEPECKSYDFLTDPLEEYLLQAQSY